MFAGQHDDKVGAVQAHTPGPVILIGYNQLLTAYLVFAGQHDDKVGGIQAHTTGPVTIVVLSHG